MLAVVAGGTAPLAAQTLEAELLRAAPGELAADAKKGGDPKRGAILFFQSYMACAKCHAGSPENRLGPDLAQLGKEKEATDAHLVESILAPSKVIRKGFETISVVTADGKSLTGLLLQETPEALTLREAGGNLQKITIAKGKIEERSTSNLSIMPAGQANQLASRQQFLDLVSYLMAIRDGGPQRELELRPDPALVAAPALPAYESQIDHARLIQGWNEDAFKRGEKIYLRVCANCHGTHDRAGSLPTSLRFAEGKFKNGNDPFAMYQTITRGFGFMTPQSWMVPRQKYEVIHYIREAYLRPRNPSQLAAIDAAYLARLPKGTTLGPEPSNIEPWVAMDYGPSMLNTFEVPRASSAGADAPPNFAYKALAIRLDPGSGGVSRGNHWLLWDHDTYRVAAIWSGKGFIDWAGIHFDGQHNAHPKLVGQMQLTNPVGPGWANPADNGWEDPRIVGRDGRHYGPLPRDWATYHGHYQHRERTVLSYRIGSTEILESPRLVSLSDAPPTASEKPVKAAAPPSSDVVYVRDFHLGKREKPLTLAIATIPGAITYGLRGEQFAAASQGPLVFAADGPGLKPAADAGALSFGGALRMRAEKPGDFDMTGRDYSIVARIRTRGDGTIFSQAMKAGKWVPDGKALFLRGGRLCFDIGWVGVVAAKRRIDDGKWHTVVMTWEKDGGDVRLYVDGKLDGEGKLQPKATHDDFVIRVGYAADDFPETSTYTGELRDVAFLQQRLSDAEIRSLDAAKILAQKESVVASWPFQGDVGKGGVVVDATGRKHDGHLEGEPGAAEKPAGELIVGRLGLEGARWSLGVGGRLQLGIPAGDAPVSFSLWTTSAPRAAALEQARLAESRISAVANLPDYTKGSAARWPEEVTTNATLGSSEGPFAVDQLAAPDNNPWFAQTRLTGFDFYDDGDRAAVCSWDGDVWLVRGLKALSSDSGPSTAEPQRVIPSPKLTWKRIASGLFQPLGLKLIKGQIYVTCRDQIVILRDLNQDGETDFYECFNQDHQVTEHFHEFAMGLQVDAAGNLYYAKSARHALKAIVPHHGTLLRVAPDGSRTDILANGFRAANGVCLNPDGSFIVTDQEGHWNPKNRINWVTLSKDGQPKFYGNLFGYTDKTDPADSAMEPPLCWITNAFDRSPAELLWVSSEKWGPLKGSLLNLSYGYGKVFVVPHEKVDGVWQGGMCELPIPAFPTGVMRGRFHPVDGQLYLCGMFAWAGSATKPGGFYRLRYTGQPVQLPIGLAAKKDGMELRFSGPIDPESVRDLTHFTAKAWDLKRSANYGSPHLNEHPVAIRSAKLSADRQTLLLEMPGLAPTWCMEIRYALQSAEGKPVNGTIHHTIHRLGAEAAP